MNYGGLAVVVSVVVVWCESYKVVEFGVGWQQQQPHAQRGAEAQGAPSTLHPAAPHTIPQASGVTAGRRSEPRSRRLGFSELNSKSALPTGNRCPVPNQAGVRRLGAGEVCRAAFPALKCTLSARCLLRAKGKTRLVGASGKALRIFRHVCCSSRQSRAGCTATRAVFPLLQ